MSTLFWGPRSTKTGSFGLRQPINADTSYALARDLGLVQARQARLRSGLKKPKEKKKSWFLDELIPDDVERGVSQIAQSLIYTLPGLYEVSRGVSSDIADVIRYGDVTPERTLGLGKSIAQGYREDFTNPRENIGYLTMDLFGLASLGLGTAARGGAAARAFARARPGSPIAESLGKLASGPRSVTEAAGRMGAFAPGFRPKLPEERGLQNPTLTEQADEVGVQPSRAVSTFGRKFKEIRARRQLASYEHLISTRPNPRPTLQEEAQLRQLRREAGIAPPEQAPLGPAPRAPAWKTAAEAVPGKIRPEVAPDPAALALQQQKLTERLGRVSQGRLESEISALGQVRPLALPDEPRPPYANLQRQVLEGEGAFDRPQIPGQLQLEGLAPLPIGRRLPPEGGTSEQYVAPPAPTRRPPGTAARARRDVEIDRAITERQARAGAAGTGEGFTPAQLAQLAQLFETRAPEPELVPEPPRPAHRPKNEEGLSAPEKAKINQTFKGLTVTRKEQGTFDLEYGGQRVGSLEPKLDDEGDHISWADSTARKGRKSMYDLRMRHPERRGQEVRLSISAEDGIDAYRKAKTIMAEWLALRRLGDPAVRDRTAASKLEDLAKKEKRQRKTKKKGKPENWEGALRPSEEVGTPDPDSTWNPLMKDEDVGDPRLREELLAARSPQDLEAELAAVDEPDAEMLAALEDEMAGEIDELKGNLKDDLSEQELDDIFSAPEDDLEMPADTKMAKAASLQPFVKGPPKKLPKTQVEALNKQLDPALKDLGLQYDNTGFLTVQRTVQKETLTPLGLNVNEYAKVQEAVKGLAGKVEETPTRSQFLKALTKAYKGDKKAAGELAQKLFGARGGAPESSAEVWRQMWKAFKAPRERQTATVSARLATLNEKGQRVFEEVTSDAIPLSNNVLVRSAWHTVYGALQLLQNPYANEGAGNLATRRLRKKLQFEQREVKRINQLVAKAGVHRDIAKLEREMEKAKQVDFERSPLAAVDTVNRAAMMGLLFLKPAYLSANMIGQIGLAMIDHGFNPANIYRSVKIQRELYKDGQLAGWRASKIKQAMGEGLIESMSAGPGMSRRVFQVHNWTANKYAKLLDTPFRDNAFINEAHRYGHNTPEKVAALVDAPEGSTLYNEFIQIARRANRNMIDYGRMNGTEKQYVRRILIFYPWLKGASIYGARFAAEHPLQMGVMMQLGKDAAERRDEQLGLMPSFMAQQGVFKTGEREVPGLGVVPEVFNPAAVSILGTPGEVLNMGRAAIAGDIKPSEELAESMTPAATAALTAITGTNPFTGAKADPEASMIERAFGSLAETLPGYRQYKQIQKADAMASGELDPREVLIPSNRQDVAARWLGPGFGALVGNPGATYPVNPREMRERAQAESRAAGTKRESRMAQFKDYRDRAKLEANKVGVTLPPEFDKAMHQKAQREAEIAALEESLGRDSDSYEKLESDMRLLVQRKEMTAKEARDLLSSYAELDKASIDRLRRQIGDYYFGGDVRSYYKKLLTLAGAEIDRGW